MPAPGTCHAINTHHEATSSVTLTSVEIHGYNEHAACVAFSLSWNYLFLEDELIMYRNDSKMTYFWSAWILGSGELRNIDFSSNFWPNRSNR